MVRKRDLGPEPPAVKVLGIKGLFARGMVWGRRVFFLGSSALVGEIEAQGFIGG
jgi:hypothetical protein